MLFNYAVKKICSLSFSTITWRTMMALVNRLDPKSTRNHRFGLKRMKGLLYLLLLLRVGDGGHGNLL